METLMVVGCDPAHDRADELNDWYSWVHIRDVMRLPGSLSAQRFVLSPVQPASNPAGPPFSFLALYEIADKAACNRGHIDHCFTDSMPISTAFDFEAFHEAYFDPLAGPGDRLAPTSAEQPVMLIAAMAKSGCEGRFEDALTKGGLSGLAGLPGFASAAAFRFGSAQMMDLPPRSSHIVVCHLSDLSLAVACWDRFIADRPSSWNLIDPASLRADVFLPLMRRLEAGTVLSESAEEREIAAQARAALGDAVHKPGANTHL